MRLARLFWKENSQFCLIFHPILWKRWQIRVARVQTWKILWNKTISQTSVKESKSVNHWRFPFLFPLWSISDVESSSWKMSLADSASLSLAFRKIQGQFDSVFTPFMQQTPKFQPNCQLWSVFKPSHVGPGTSANLPRLCGKCRGPNASKLPDHFPQCSSSGMRFRDSKFSTWGKVTNHSF